MVRYTIIKEPVGDPILWEDVVRASGWINVITSPYLPVLTLKDGHTAKAVSFIGNETICLGRDDFPSDRVEQARSILRTLAVKFNDWASGEIVERAERDMERTKT